MSRGGRGSGGRGGGRGGFKGGAFSSGGNPPMGLTFADIQAMSREGDALYPPLDPLPVLSDFSAEENKICELQTGFIDRLRKSPYYVVETIKSIELERYSDKYRQTSASLPALKRKDLHAPFFPTDIFEGYFNPKKKRKDLTSTSHRTICQEKSGEERSDAGSQAVESDYDVEEEYDNDYAENYFDNGEGDDLDDLGGGVGGDDGGGGEIFDFFSDPCLNFFSGLRLVYL
ncbi:DNA-directed RNA polymerase III subunit Rpc31-domain-containing protein [Boletus edulis]|nr:DNA-directed RNA polymerase III subunit Rpc31-domain-containing protein [Boletus edulis]